MASEAERLQEQAEIIELYKHACEVAFAGMYVKVYADHLAKLDRMIAECERIREIANA